MAEALFNVETFRRLLPSDPTRPTLREIVDETIAGLADQNPEHVAADAYDESELPDLQLRKGVGVLAVLAQHRFYKGGVSQNHNAGILAAISLQKEAPDGLQSLAVSCARP